MADDIAALLDALGIKGKVALAGVAVGGATALHFAARYPAAHQRRRGGKPRDRACAGPSRGRPRACGKMERDGMSGAVEDSMATGYAVELRGNAERFARFRARWLGNDPGSFAAIYRMLASMEMQEELRTLACPVLVIGATFDRVRPPPMAEAVADTIPAARYVELPTTHFMAAATPELIADTIGDFLKSVGA